MFSMLCSFCDVVQFTQSVDRRTASSAICYIGGSTTICNIVGAHGFSQRGSWTLVQPRDLDDAYHHIFNSILWSCLCSVEWRFFNVRIDQWSAPPRIQRIVWDFKILKSVAMRRFCMLAQSFWVLLLAPHRRLLQARWTKIRNPTRKVQQAINYPMISSNDLSIVHP